MGDLDAKSSEKKIQKFTNSTKAIIYLIYPSPLPPSLPLPPPKEKNNICKTIVFDFSWGECNTQ